VLLIIIQYLELTGPGREEWMAKKAKIEEEKAAKAKERELRQKRIKGEKIKMTQEDYLKQAMQQK
jgi:hypothetical protein